MEGLEMRYFVLKPRGISAFARASRAAMRTFAEIIDDENQVLSGDIYAWVKKEEDRILSKKEV